jgi:hypothetical protein
MMEATTPGLSTPDQVEALADQLSACADALHARLMKAIRSGGDTPGIDLDHARALLDDEAVLRQRADSLYADCARNVVQGLGVSQQHLLALTTAATEQIRHIQLTGDLAGLVAAMLSMAGAAASGQAAAILLALEHIHHQLQALQADQPPTI